ncbi:GGDEF domain-containing protein [Cocleimonas sp. KMM 6892]|uniref:GGDEF domain-containing protein n=1 Tax=unclassified Cocleimonas TaxID=2639732 RepID=UPI002DB60E94|nr:MULTISPECIES: GGDEF domain-containing protein [unclassified Cocleimonas]MEB8431926.1 GGDEF domain-containing protein [Cocleimonas sp. KMM 6892]MEC4714988.1 GGDEF domain-containing protein [Cocleimonas sp. KMM 6895]MEC4744198.1 GGDEF domain-containing protein [Cocleimonas sp. KMM 6896]
MILTSKPTKEETASFNQSVLEEKVNSTRVIVILGALLFIVYTIMDKFGLPEETLETIYLARGTLLVVLAYIYYLTYQNIFQKYYIPIVMAGYFACGIAISIGVYVSQAGEYSYDLYFAALIILVATSFSWSYLPIKVSIFISALFIITYICMRVFAHKDIEGARLLTLMSQVFYLLSIGVVAATAQYIRDTLIYKNIRLQKNLIKEAEEQTKEAEKQEMLANLDALTGIPNRRYITECLELALKDAQHTNTLLVLIFLDLNGFKEINDTYGHDSGDRVLEVTAKRLKHTIREDDYLARIGGDEFLIGFKTDQFSAKFIDSLCAKLKKNISDPIAFNKHKLKVGVSIGCASYPGDGETIDELIKISDKHMYLDKQEGRRSKTM